jgi:hypothetical protein
MRRVLIAALATAAIGIATPASAALTVEGITYDLILNSVTDGGKTGNFTLQISGINVAGTDTRGGRTGIDAFAFNDPAIGTAVSGTVSSPVGWSFQFGGLNSDGCNGTGNFFCFRNTSATFPTPLPSSLALNFAVTSDTAGSWANYAGDFKIDWAGSANNYNLVSQVITARTPPVPEPATWAMMLVGFGGIGMAMRRSRRGMKLAQVA